MKKEGARGITNEDPKEREHKEIMAMLEFP
jgi:hypothetical protein